MGYGEKVKKWFFDEDGDGEDIAEDYDAVEVDTEPVSYTHLTLPTICSV